jgi:hypothetical protein
MPNVSNRLKSLPFILGAFAFLSFAPSQCPEAKAQSARVGQVVGNLDGIAQDGDQVFISGWACQQGQKKSIVVAIFVDHSAYDTQKGTFIMNGIANLDSEPAVGQACQDREGGKHRFVIELPAAVVGKGRETRLYLHGGRVMNGVPNAAIAGSGAQLGHLPRVDLQYPTLPAFPALSGAYRNLAEHPRVFTTAAELKDITARINRPDSYSKRRFGQLADQIKRDLASNVDWDATYSGCDIDIYLHAFTIEPRGGYQFEIRSEDQLRTSMHVRPGASAPAGAAGVAARLALYAALLKAGAVAPPGAPSADQAAALARRILLAWSEHAFRDEHGQFRTQSQFCDGNGKPSNPGLHLSRGVVNTVHAQDLLMYVGALGGNDVERIDAFHSAMFDLIRRASNSGMGESHPACERYANGQASELESLLALARLFDDGRKFSAVLYGADRSIPVLLPWTVFFNHAIYGESDSPLECYPNNGTDALTSHPSYITPTVTAGEIQDRYRNQNPSQGILYAMGTLGGLINAAEILRISGFDPYSYLGTHKQSIVMAIDYYACYARCAGFHKTVNAEDCGRCLNAAQYYGKIVNGVEKPVMLGLYRFPQKASFSDLETAAKNVASSEIIPLDDEIYFGKWRD